MAVLEHFRLLSEARFLALYEGLSERGYGPLDGELAKQLKFRPQAIRKIPLAKRAKLARSWIENKKSVDLCYELFGTYLVRNRKELVTGFLDATGVPHQEGMIEDIERARPDAQKIAGAVRELDGKFGADDVTLYLALCAEQWPGVPELSALWRERSGAPAA